MLWLGSRLWLAAFAYIGHLTHPFQQSEEGSYIGVSNWWLNVWTYYDSQHYFSISQSGYTAKTSAFFPLYPLFLRPFAPDENAMALAGIFVSNVAFFFALALFLAIVRRDYSPKFAKNAAFLLAFFPMAVSSVAVYTESLFLVLGLSAWWFAGEKRWLWCAFFALGAALTRNTGPILFLALGAWWLQDVWRARKNGEPLAWSGLLAVLAPLAAFVAMQLVFRAQFAEGASTLSAQSQFLRSLHPPWWPILQDIRLIFAWDFGLVLLLNLGASLGAFALIWFFRRETRLPDAILVLSVMLLHLTFSRLVPPYTNGALRYAFSLWPFSILLAIAFDRLRAFHTPRAQIMLATFYMIYGGLLAFAWGQKLFLG